MARTIFEPQQPHSKYLFIMCIHTHTNNNNMIMANMKFKFCLFKIIEITWGKHYGLVVGILLVNECLKLSTKIKSTMFLLIKFNFDCDRAKLSPGRYWLRWVFSSCFTFIGIYFQIFLIHPPHQGRLKF